MTLKTKKFKKLEVFCLFDEELYGKYEILKILKKRSLWKKLSCTVQEQGKRVI